ncbi:hypothetical protein GCM10027290_61530 [Micromonospora sonneratiae]
MGEWTDKAWELRNSKGKVIEEHTKLHREWLYQEGPGEGATASGPEAAEDAADRLEKVLDGLTSMRGELRRADLDRSGYWTGPAANVFGDTVEVFLKLMDEIGKRVGEYAYATRNLVAIPHGTAQKNFDTHLHGYIHPEWSRINKDGKGTDEHSSLWRAMDHPAYWRDKNSTNSASEERRFWAAREKYIAAVDTVIDNMKSIRKTIVRTLSDAYLAAAPEYRFLPSGPDFSSVKVKSDATDEGGDEKDDKSDLDLGGGDDGLGGLDDKLNNLLDGGGSGGGLDGLGSGGGLDLGSSGSGGGLDGLGSGGGLDLGAGGGLGGLRDGSLVTGPDGTRGLDLTGNGVPDLSTAGVRLPGSDLPVGSRVVRRPDGSMGVDLDGDGVADVGMDGRALRDGSAPEGSQLVTGPDGTTGYDITGNDVPDLSLDLQPLPGGDLPEGSQLVAGGIDLDGDGIADMSLDGRALPGSGPAAGGQVATGPDGRTGFDMNGDGVPDIGFDGRPMNPDSSGSPDSPGSPDPSGWVPTDQVRRVSGGEGSTTSADSSMALPGQGGLGYPPPIPPAVGAGAGGANNNERERQTWLQEDEEVWTDDLMPVTALGRPVFDDEEEDVVDEWAAPVRRPRGVPRPQRPSQGGWQSGASRR